ncbi:MAG TPA: PDZ domain-containing protein [Fimbriimonadaceae bacterium]|nr:PDZ domain-containing protein [Fimbriimonadaceae bacterium]
MLTLLAATALIVTRPNPIEIPFRIGEDAIILDATVNGKKCSFMFDTGFSGSFVLDDTINIGKADGEITLQDFVGTFAAKTVKLTTLKFGDSAVPIDHTMSVVQQPLAHMSFSYNTHTDGIMGMETLQNYVVEINVEKQKMILHPRTMDITKRTPDNIKTFLVKMLPTGVNSIKLDVVAKNGKKMRLGFDTGNAFFATTHKDVLQRIGLWGENDSVKFMRSAWVASGPVDSWYKFMTELTIFGVPVRQSVWSIIDLPSSSAEDDGTVGFQFLKNFNSILDIDRRRVWMENFTGKTGNDPVADIGVSMAFDPRNKRMRVYRVMPASPGEKAGIKAGDDVLSIDGTELLDVGFRDVEKLLEGKKGSKVKLAVSRGGNLQRYEIERDYLINGLPAEIGP